MSVPTDLRYTKDHEWVRVAGDTATIGVTAYAADQLGDVVFVELPKVGTKVTAKQSFGVVESVKAVSDLFAPLSGEIVEINGELPNVPQTVNQDPYDKGWMIVIAPSKPDEWNELLTASQYEQFLNEGH